MQSRYEESELFLQLHFVPWEQEIKAIIEAAAGALLRKSSAHQGQSKVASPAAPKRRFHITRGVFPSDPI